MNRPLRACGNPECQLDISHRDVRAKYCNVACKNVAYHRRDPEKFRKKDRTRRSQPHVRARYQLSATAWREANVERNAENIRRWRMENRETHLAGLRDYRQRNPEKVRLYQNNRRASLAKSKTFAFSERDWRRLVDRFGARCAYCNQPSTELQLEHVVPVSRGGDSGAGNYLPACPSCNRSKGARFLMEWRLSKRGV